MLDSKIEKKVPIASSIIPTWNFRTLTSLKKFSIHFNFLDSKELLFRRWYVALVVYIEENVKLKNVFAV